MSRLTERDKSLTESSAFDNLDAFDMIDWQEMIYDQLQKYENFMEDFGIKDLEELKDAMQELLETNNHIKEVSDKYYIYYKEKFNRVLELAEECQTLNDRWKKLKEFIQKDHDWNLEQDNNDCALAERWVLEEMQKLEEEE